MEANQNRNEAMTTGPPQSPVIQFDLDAVRVRDDSWTGRVSVNGSIILEAEGNHGASQAIANAEDDFVMFLRWSVDQWVAYMEAEADKETA